MDFTKDLFKNSANLDLLYVEDDDELRSQMSNIFVELFKHVDTAENGQIGLEKFRAKLQKDNTPYDLIITDIKMPFMNGVEMLKEIYPDYPFQSVIVISAHSESDYLLELIGLGVDNFLIKPVFHEDLIKTLYKSTQNIMNKKLIDAYGEEINRLKSKNS